MTGGEHVVGERAPARARRPAARRRTRRRSSADVRSDRQAVADVEPGGQPVEPAGQVLGGHPPQHGVDQPGDPLPHRGRGQVDGGRHGGRGPAPASPASDACPAGAGRAPPAARLVRAATGSRLDDQVVGALAAAGAGQQLRWRTPRRGCPIRRSVSRSAATRFAYAPFAVTRRSASKATRRARSRTAAAAAAAGAPGAPSASERYEPKAGSAPNATPRAQSAAGIGFLPWRLHLAELERAGAGADIDGALGDLQSARGQLSSGRLGRVDLEPLAAEGGPGARVPGRSRGSAGRSRRRARSSRSWRPRR